MEGHMPESGGAAPAQSMPMGAQGPLGVLLQAERAHMPLKFGALSIRGLSPLSTSQQVPDESLPPSTS